MKKVILISCALFTALLSGCSLITTGEYLTPNIESRSSFVDRADWVTDSSEPSFGRFRPSLRGVSLGGSEDAEFVVYPIIIRERAISFGPMFLPLIPVFDCWQDPPSQYCGKVRFLFDGDVNIEQLGLLVDGSAVATEIHEGLNGDQYILSDIVNSERDSVCVEIIWGESSRSFYFEKEKTRCFVPFTSFN